MQLQETVRLQDAVQLQVIVPLQETCGQEDAPLRSTAPKGREEDFSQKRAAEDELLTEYKVWPGTRTDFALAKNVKLGTLDGIFARARKRSKAP